MREIAGRITIKYDTQEADLASILIFQGKCRVFKPVKLAATVTLLLSSSGAIAVPFSSFDPRSMAMGGAGASGFLSCFALE